LATRTGLPTIVEVSKRLCALINAFSPIIRKLYPDNTALINALEAAQAACYVLHQVAQDQIVIGE